MGDETMKTVYINGRDIPDRAALHDALAAGFELPAYYGRNLDALYDLLTEPREPARVILAERGLLEARLGQYFHSFLRVLKDADIAYQEDNIRKEEECHMPDCAHKTVDLTLLDETLSEYAGVKGSLISILQKTQDIYGYIPIDAVYRVAERTGLSPAKILGVATFYSQFRFQAIGKYLIMLCRGTACYVNGAERILDAVTDELGIDNNETTEDGLFSLSVVSCLGCCSLAPVMMINDKTYGSLTPDKTRQILRELRKEAENG